MKIMIGIAHPKQVHFWKNIINNLNDDGHEVKIVAWKKDITLCLLDKFNFEYEVGGINHSGLLRKAYGLLESDFKVLKIAKKFRPDILLGSSPSLAQISKLIGKPHIALSDTEHAVLVQRLLFPFSDVICTPSCFRKKIDSRKHVTFESYLELAYLHPNYFKPDSSVLDDLELSKNEKFIIIRLISWEATHDAYSKGLSLNYLEKAIDSLKNFGNVFITSEAELNKNLVKYKINLSPEKIHSALYYANLYFGEGGTTAVEAALLGTPAVHVEAFITKSGEVKDATQIHGNFDELVNKYGILYTFADPNQALNKALEVVEDINAKKGMGKKMKRLLNEKIDVTAFMTDFIEKYPQKVCKAINKYDKKKNKK
jgi:hypothetical protein